MQKNKTTELTKLQIQLRQEYIKHETGYGLDWEAFEPGLLRIISQEREQWEEKLGKTLADNFNKSKIKDHFSFNDILSLLESGKDMYVPSKIESKEERSE